MAEKSTVYDSCFVIAHNDKASAEVAVKQADANLEEAIKANDVENSTETNAGLCVAMKEYVAAKRKYMDAVAKYEVAYAEMKEAERHQ